MDDKEIDDKIAALQQGAEQAGAALREIARMLGQFRAGLIEAGFTTEEIIPLVVTQLQLWWVSIMQENNNTEGTD